MAASTTVMSAVMGFMAKPPYGGGERSFSDSAGSLCAFCLAFPQMRKALGEQ